MVIRGFAKKDKNKKKKTLYPSKIAPVEYEGEREDSTQTPITSLPATFIPAPGGYQGRVAQVEENNSRSDRIEQPDRKEMEEFFKKRTDEHIGRVEKYLRKLEKHYPYQFTEEHDATKWKEPEYEPYLYITWKHKVEDENPDYEIPEEWKEKCDDATFHHIKHNKHHPEYWDDSLTENPINKNDRNKTDRLIDATKMPDKNILEMVADWCAMSEEKGNTPKEWADKNIGVRWKFTPEQEDLIYEGIDAAWSKEKKSSIKGFTKHSQTAPGQIIQNLDTPQIEIDPTIRAEIQDAVDQILATDPSYFRGVSKIVALDSGPYGQVSSDDPSVLHLNVQRIKNEIKSRFGSFNSQNPEHREALEEAIKQALVEVIAHEKGHALDWDPERRIFPGGEGVAEQESQKMVQRVFPASIRNFTKQAQKFTPGEFVSVRTDPSQWGTYTGESKEEPDGLLYYKIRLNPDLSGENEDNEVIEYQWIAEPELERINSTIAPNRPGNPSNPSGGWGGGNVLAFCKEAQYSSDIAIEWQKALRGIDEPPGALVNMPKLLPSLWQEVLVRAYREGGEKLVEIFEQHERLPNLTILIPYDTKKAMSIEAMAEDNLKSLFISLALGPGRVRQIKEGNLEVIEYINSIILHEFKHIIDRFTKGEEWYTDTRKQRRRESEERQDILMESKRHSIPLDIKGYIGERYALMRGETSAIAAEIAESVRSLKQQGYSYEKIKEIVSDRVVKHRKGWKHTRKLDDLLNILIDEAYSEGEINPGTIDEETTETLQKEPWWKKLIGLLQKKGEFKGLTKAAQKLTIGLDIDGVIADLHDKLLEIARKYTNIPEDEKQEYKLRDMNGVSRDVENRVFEELFKTHQIEDVPVVPGAVEIINSWYDLGHKIILLTARAKHWKEQTEKWLNNIGLKYDQLVFDDNKGEQAQQMGIDIFIDDKPENVLDLQAHDVEALLFEQPWNQDMDLPQIQDWAEFKKTSSIQGLSKSAAPRWTTEEKNRLKQIYLKYRERSIPHHIIYKAAAELLGKSFNAVKQKLESMYDLDEDLAGMKYEHWDKCKIDNMIQEMYRNGQPVSRLSIPATLMYQITNHSLPKAETRGFPVYYDSFDHAMATNILAVGFEREGDILTEKPISTLDEALQYYRRREKQAHTWTPQEIIALFRDAHAAGLPLTYSFFKSHPDIYKPLLGVGRSLEGLRDSITRIGCSWADLVIEAAPEYVDLYNDNGRLRDSTEEVRVQRFLELNEIPFRRTTIADKIRVEDPELIEMGYNSFVPDFYILDDAGDECAIVEVFGSVADSGAANTSEVYREKKKAKEKFYQTLPLKFIAVNNNADGIELSDQVLLDKFADYLKR